MTQRINVGDLQVAAELHDFINREVLRHPAVRARFQSLVTDLSLTATGSANRVARLLLLAEPPSIDKGEVTDKGTTEQWPPKARPSEFASFVS